jgi:CxxC motif-containing protein (DUF1111 family)
MRTRIAVVSTLVVTLVILARAAPGQLIARDPGVRRGAAGAGGMLPGLTATQQAFFASGRDAFSEADGETGASYVSALSNQTVNLFSDLLLHRMGPGLADDIVQGDAGPDEFRTAPLWGLGQRLFFLHDGRTSDLVEAIQAHASPATGRFAASEANGVIARFRALRENDKQDLVNFLRSL